MSRLTFKYEYDESFFDKRLPRDDFGLLTVSVVTDQFSGTGGFWVQWREVKEFGESLSTFPITSDEPPKAEWSCDNDFVSGVTISPANATGDMLVRVKIADHYEPSRNVSASFLTNYPNIEAFRLSIINLMDRKVDEAILRGQ